ncbi:MAG: sulfurtransferase TusA family protein [Bacillaceae bacterium]
MKQIKANELLDAKGLACPMPIVKTRKIMKDLDPGTVLEIQATDKGSKADLKAWAESTGQQYLGTIEDGNVLKHYIRKSSGETIEKKHPNTVENQQLLMQLTESNGILIDVREEAEYAFTHIPNAVSIPLDTLENKMTELPKDRAIYVICHTGSRSDLAAQKLTNNGFSNVINVLPGMSQWDGETTNLD